MFTLILATELLLGGVKVERHYFVKNSKGLYRLLPCVAHLFTFNFVTGRIDPRWAHPAEKLVSRIQNLEDGESGLA